MRLSLSARPVVLCILFGGLGNQMFQYAAARALSLQTKSRLYLNCSSGFKRDYQYKRTFQINRLPISSDTYNVQLPIWIKIVSRFLGFFSKLRLATNRFFLSIFDGQVASSLDNHSDWLNCMGFQFCTDSESCFQPRILSNGFSLRVLSGYWQSPSYFARYRYLILQELSPPCPQDQETARMGGLFRDHETVAVGIRLYEESSDSYLNAHKGKIKSLDAVNQTLMKLKSQHPGLRVAIFCTHHSPLIDQNLSINKDTYLIFPEYGFSDPVDTLWLLMQCKYHIFLNSTFYWWGAWLSQAIYGDVGVNVHPRIYAADNFINQDVYDVGWEKF